MPCGLPRSRRRRARNLPSELGKLASEMLVKVDQLDRELAELRREADLLDARKDADALWARYAPPAPSTL